MNTQQIATNISYKSNKTYTLLVQISFWIFVATCVVSSVCAIYLLKLLRELIHFHEEVQETFSMFASTFDYITIIIGLTYIFCAIFFLLWIYRASKNAHALIKDSTFEFRPGWAVGAFFIPILNIYWPYKVVKEIWIKCVVAINSKKGIAFILIWWLTYIFSNVAIQITSTISLTTPASIKNYLGASLIANLLAISAAIMVIIIVKKINTAQTILASEK